MTAYPIKVLFVSPTVALYDGGTETVVRQLARCLAPQVELTVLSGTTGARSDPPDPGRIAATLVTVPFLGRDTRRNRFLRQVVRLNPFKVESRSFFGSLAAASIDLSAYDALVTFYEMDAYLLSRNYPGLASRCVHLLPGVSLRRFFRLVDASSVVFLGYRAGTRAERKWGVRIPAVPLGVDTAYFPSAPPACPVDRRLLFIGRLDRSKHVDWLAEFFVCSDLPARGYTLEIIGDGPLAPALQARFGTSPAIRLHGRKDSQQVVALLRGARLILHPSGLESFGLTILEAMAAGIPVVTHDLPSIRAWALEHPAYAAHLDRNAWGEAISAFEDPSRWARISAANLDFARSFTWDRVANTLLAILRRRTATRRSQD